MMKRWRSINDYSLSRNNNFQLIRVIAAALVVFSHSFPVARGACIEPPGPYMRHSFGTLAVMIFFTISGYLVAQSWSSRRAPLRFLCARILRIYPALIISIFITVFLVGFSVTDVSFRTI
jgi:peptidoglycan/LPS O-acetylase OafA/YrhL